MRSGRVNFAFAATLPCLLLLVPALGCNEILGNERATRVDENFNEEEPDDDAGPETGTRPAVNDAGLRPQTSASGSANGPEVRTDSSPAVEQPET